MYSPVSYDEKPSLGQQGLNSVKVALLDLTKTIRLIHFYTILGRNT
jgi:hypothetical protein